jgi:hypothetical protein
MFAAAAQAAAVAWIADGVAVTTAVGGAATRRLVEAPKRGPWRRTAGPQECAPP